MRTKGRVTCPGLSNSLSRHSRSDVGVGLVRNRGLELSCLKSSDFLLEILSKDSYSAGNYVCCIHLLNDHIYHVYGERSSN